MKRALLLGPGHWKWPVLHARGATPLEVRHRIQDVMEAEGVDAVLLEDEPDQAREADDLALKFHRLLDEGPMDAIVVYWPRGAKMQTTWDELVILREEQLRHERGERGTLPPLHYLSHLKAMSIDDARLHIHERGGRSAYLRGVSQLGGELWPWLTDDQLVDAAAHCAARIAGLTGPQRSRLSQSASRPKSA
ncbi:MAG: hypothetical protein HYT80_07890 [Euryarchaeota archaeon]|nr:hypothetical protein [Euryarchaeota archaeon]